MRVVHTTGYNYDSPVTSSYNEARLTPRSDNRQNVILNRVETDPATRSYRYTDYWGTAVTAFDLHAPHTALEVAGSSVVETDPFTEPEEILDWDDLVTPALYDRYNELLGHSEYVPKNKTLASMAKKLSKDLNPYEAVVAIANWVNEEMSYVPGTTDVHTSAVEAWTDKRGVCQDYAHLTLLMLRSIDIPCRYVSGYLHPNAEAELGVAVEGQSHAWVEAWTGSWWGYDPTNAGPIAEQHVTVGIGRDYADVPPLKGIFSGGGSTELDVVVEITRLA